MVVDLGTSAFQPQCAVIESPVFLLGANTKVFFGPIVKTQGKQNKEGQRPKKPQKRS